METCKEHQLLMNKLHRYLTTLLSPDYICFACSLAKDDKEYYFSLTLIDKIPRKEITFKRLAEDFEKAVDKINKFFDYKFNVINGNVAAFHYELTKSLILDTDFGFSHEKLDTFLTLIRML